MIDKKKIEHIFRAYDIRGIYNDDINEEIFERIGNVFSFFVDDTVVVGCDNRESSQSLKEAFIEGVTSAGKNVIDVGMTTKPITMFVGLQKNMISAFVTASHLPPEYNGIKFAYSNGIAFPKEDNIKIKELFMSEKTFSGKKGSVVKINPFEDYKNYLIKKIPDPEKKLRILLDCGNGTAGLVVRDLFEKKGYDVDTIFEEPDGRFPNRESELLDTTLGTAKELSKKYDVAFAYDGDADRMALIYNGKLLSAEEMAFIVLKEILKKRKGYVVTNVECSRIIDKIVKENGSAIERVPVGFTYMIQAVYRRNAVYGIERSLHSCIPEVMPFDDAVAISLYTAYIVSKLDLEKILKEVPITFMERINFACDEKTKFEIMNRIEKTIRDKYNKYEINTMDGIRIDFPDSWILLRPSNTSPMIRLTIEADRAERLEELKREFSKIIEDNL